MMQRDRYPADWSDISRRIRERAGNRCEWCGVANGAHGYRDESGAFVDTSLPEFDHQMLRWLGRKLFRIVLTTAHLGVDLPDGRLGDQRDKSDCRDENLAALCQRCHLNHDRDEHAFNAAWTRRRKRIEAGQMELI
jgi:hypothetical protein